LAPPKFTRPTGADVVMESISLKSPQGRQMSVIEIFRQLTNG
jgi:hypothetical protein